MLCFYVRSKLISTVCYYHVKYAFQSESTLYSCLNVKKLFALNRRNISSLSDSNTIRTHSHLVRPLATTTGQMTELCCEYLSVWCIWLCYYHVTYEFQSESTIYSFPKCQGTSCLKQAPYLKIKWQQQDSNPQPLSS